YANIPTKDDPDWEAAPIDEDGDLCWRLDRSVLTTPFTALDFTYFQTSVFVSDATLPFLLRFYQVDDGARAYVFNSTHPDGEYVVGGDARLYAPIAETDLSPLFVEGEENRIVIVQFDDSQTQNYLKVETITEDDVNNCNIAIENIFVADQACDGSEIGAIEINASCSSCTEDPLYSIDGGQTFQDLSFIRVSAGEYTVVIRDANDETCISDATTIVVGIGEDNIPPSFPGAENVPLQNIPICTLVEELPAVYNQSFVTDNCDPNPMVDIQREVVTINDTISIDDGLSERIIERGRQVNFIYTAIDISNNQSSITIPTWFIPKDESPIVEIANTNIQDILNVCGEYPISAESLGATATDDCTTNLALEIRIRNEAGQTIEAINSAGRYSVTISTTDDSGRTGSTNVIIELSPNPAFYTVNAEDDMFDEVTSPYTFTVAELLANDNASNNVELEIQEINLVDTNAGTLVQNGDGSYTLTRANNGVEQIQLTYVAK
ncbi:MAG: cadherin-like domain-containing protein, partial [Bacteroidota bacterium]